MLTHGHLEHAQTTDTCKHTHPGLSWAGTSYTRARAHTHTHTHAHAPLLPSGGQCSQSRRGIITWVAAVVTISFRKV